MTYRNLLCAIVFSWSGMNYASADVCDYRPSNLMGGGATGVVATTAAGTAAAGAAAQAAGFYTLTHAASGLTMLASTAGGASAAGTVGIMGGTGGIIGTTAAIIMAPATIIGGAIVGAGVAAYEGVCFFTVERLDDPVAIAEVVNNIVDNGDPKKVRLSKRDGKSYLLVATEHDDDGEPVAWETYKVAKLYIESGQLRHKDFGLNSNLGTVNYYETVKSK